MRCPSRRILRTVVEKRMKAQDANLVTPPLDAVT